MKKNIKMKNETIEFLENKVFDEQLDNRKLKAKLSFWKPLGILFIIITIVFVVSAMIFNLNSSSDYKIYRTDCHNETKVIPCGLVNYQNRTIYVCPSYYVETNTDAISGVSNVLPQEEICNTTEINELPIISQSCVAHSPSKEMAIFNCVSILNKKDLSERVLNDMCQCDMKIMTYACVNPLTNQIRDDCKDLDKEDYIGKCVHWKCGEIEVKAK